MTENSTYQKLRDHLAYLRLTVAVSDQRISRFAITESCGAGVGCSS